MKNLVVLVGLIAIPFRGNNNPFPSLPPLPYAQKRIPTGNPKLKLQSTKSFIDALIYVESRGNPKAFNKIEDAAGCLQIRPIMVREVNRILEKLNSKQRFSLEDRWDCGTSKEMFYIWKNYHHSNSNNEIIARNWNGGPKGYKNPKTQKYWDKVKKQWEN